jgi:threonine/homoserine/homoserine lactone efflux protein
MSWINLSALWKILVFGLIAGAGLPAIFAGGLYSLSLGPRTGRVAAAGADGGTEESDALIGGSVLGMIVAAIAFLIVLAAIGWGIYEVYQIGHPAVKK